MNELRKVSVLNALTGEITEREMTEDELANLPEEIQTAAPTDPE